MGDSSSFLFYLVYALCHGSPILLYFLWDLIKFHLSIPVNDHSFFMHISIFECVSFATISWHWKLDKLYSQPYVEYSGRNFL